MKCLLEMISKKNKQNQRVILFVRVQKSHKERLQAKANTEQTSLAKLVEQVLEDYLEAENESDSTSVRKTG
ncbi:MAG: hypothetical protein CMA66_00825 [Euryarchaeota archaeon]|nr:hypothetical protein [Euryarchaeota archaeon]